ncbi:hypothetical protein CMT37_09120 [Elizabethkingia anophelis]|nr:hypothetical protein [Elizabethkingia anophelis]
MINKGEEWLLFIMTAINDQRLNVWHLALLSALAQLAYLQNETNVIRVSRRKLMQFSHISTLPTFHKYFKELQQKGYIKYTPSYHPGYHSTVELLINRVKL